MRCLLWDTVNRLQILMTSVLIQNVNMIFFFKIKKHELCIVHVAFRVTEYFTAF